MKQLYPLFLLLIFGLSITASAAPLEYRDIQVTRWIDPLGRTPLSYHEYIRTHPFQSLSVQRLTNPQHPTDQTPFVILVNPSLYPSISTSINTYINDLIADDFSVMLVQWGGGTPEQLRDSLISWWEDDLCEGAVMIGDLPIPWFELYEDFNDDGIPDDPFMVEFPCDLFYMDLDGTWQDQDLDSIYDVHEGNTDAEIYVGQLRASPLSLSEAGRINNYFIKNHSYRQGNLVLPSLALNFIDDDWQGSAYSWGNALRTAFGAITTVNDINQTSAANYLNRLDIGYSMIQVAVHSSPFTHSFKENNGTSWGSVQNYQIRDTDPMAYFYNLFACSNCRYVETDYMGGWYIFGETYGLGTVGSTKTGAMLYFEDYYSALAEDRTFGEALATWISLHGNIPGHQMWSRSWFYGMTHLGDPTLKVPLRLRFTSAQIDDDSLGMSLGDNDHIFDAGEQIELSLLIENPMSTSYYNVALTISTTDSLISLLNDSVTVPVIPAEGSATFNGFVIQADPLTPDRHQVLFDILLSDNLGHIWYESFELEISAPVLECTEYQIAEISGNGNQWADPGETIELNLLTHNTGDETARNMTAHMQLLSGIATITDSLVEYGDLEPDEEIFPESPFQIMVDNSHPNQMALQLQILFYIGALHIGESIIALPMSSGYNATFTFESEEPALRHYSVTDTYQDAWHRTAQYAYNSIGSEKFGDTGEGNYPPMADGALEFPLFPIGSTATLTLWHKIDAEIGYDGGIVEVNTGEGWTLLNPLGGYPYSAGNNGSFPAYSPCFSGQSEWSQLTFNLPYAAGFTKIRFRFGSDGGVEGLGWFLDDVNIFSQQVPYVDDNPEISIPTSFSLSPAYPNPFNGFTIIEFIVPVELKTDAQLTLFNILGQQVMTLWTGKDPGKYTLRWSGLDPNHRPLGSGVYFLRLGSGGISQTNKIIILR